MAASPLFFLVRIAKSSVAQSVPVPARLRALSTRLSTLFHAARREIFCALGIFFRARRYSLAVHRTVAPCASTSREPAALTRGPRAGALAARPPPPPAPFPTRSRTPPARSALRASPSRRSARAPPRQSRRQAGLGRASPAARARRRAGGRRAPPRRRIAPEARRGCSAIFCLEGSRVISAISRLYLGHLLRDLRLDSRADRPLQRTPQRGRVRAPLGERLRSRALSGDLAQYPAAQRRRGCGRARLGEPARLG